MSYESKEREGGGLRTVGFCIAAVTHITVKSIKEIIFMKTGSYRKDSFTFEHWENNKTYP